MRQDPLFFCGFVASKTWFVPEFNLTKKRTYFSLLKFPHVLHLDEISITM